MQKWSMRNLSPFKQGFISGLVGVMLAGVGLAAWTFFQGREDGGTHTRRGLPIVEKSAGQPSALTAFTRVGTVLQVFQTSSSFDGAGPAGYGRSAMHAACRQADPAAHFCTIQEVEHAWKDRASILLRPTRLGSTMPWWARATVITTEIFKPSVTGSAEGQSVIIHTTATPGRSATTSAVA